MSKLNQNHQTSVRHHERSREPKRSQDGSLQNLPERGFRPLGLANRIESEIEDEFSREGQVDV